MLYMTIGEFSIIISIIGIVPYMIGIIHGKVRPERVTWFVWSLILALGIASYAEAGGSDSTWFLIGDFLITFGVFLLSLWKGAGGLNRLDLACLGIALCGLALWQTSSLPLLGIVGALTADAVALLPTILKALKDPNSESASTFGFSSLAAMCGVLAVGEWNGVLLFYPVYLFIANFVTAIVILVGQYQVRYNRSRR